MRPYRHEFHVVSHVNRVHFRAGMNSYRHKFHFGSPCKGPLRPMIIKDLHCMEECEKVFLNASMFQAACHFFCA